jgi:ribosomal protein S18 acetylase RimI-like enzyme
VDIKKYAEKINLRGNTIEYWQDQNLIGCIAYYNNDDENEAFMTSVSVEEEYQSRGLAQKMLVEIENRINFTRIRLEVHKNNEKAMSLYLKNGFKLDSSSNEFNILIK